MAEKRAIIILFFAVLVCITLPASADTMTANFTADPTQGEAPLEVTFTDTSTGDVWEWNYDIDNDGDYDITDRAQIGCQATHYSFYNPYGICNDTVYLYVADTSNHRIVKRYRENFTYVSEIGSYGNGDDQFNNPRGITTDGTYLYVAESSNHRIVKRQCSDLSYVSKIGSSGSGDDQFYNPCGITTDGTYLYVADSYNHRIVKRNDDLSYYTPEPVWTYNIPDIYSVRQVLKGIEYESLEKLREDYIVVYTLTAAFSGTPTSGSTPLTVQFTDWSTGAGLPISSYLWDFGDGSPGSSDENPAHTYTTSGCYDVKLKVANTFGISDWENKTAYICAGNVTPTPTTPTPTPTGTIPVQGDVDTGRISPLGFVMLAFINLGLVLHTFVNNESRNYLHVFTGIVAVIVSFMLGTFLITGFVQEDFVVTAAEVTVNSSVLSTYQVEQVSIIDASVGYYFVFIGILMALIVILSVIEIIREIQEG